jgi:hypothetical protein
MPYADVQYLHFQQPLPKEMRNFSPHLLVVNYDFLNYRFSPLWPYIKNRHRELASRSSRVVAIAQDDFWAHKLLDNWCIDWKVDRILTASEENWDRLYPRSSRQIEIRSSLTGYALSSVSIGGPPLNQRPIDVGQRVRHMPMHLGRFGQLKAIQAEVFGTAATRAGFKVDVSTRVEDAFLGDSWLKFLASCKFTVGMKGGANLLDPYGLLHTRVQKYLLKRPAASFEEVEKACFPANESAFEYKAISPRIFEAASVKTCQILDRDDYLGSLEPWKHYLPLERDFSNLEEVLRAMRDLEMCQEIANQAHKVLIESGRFDYKMLSSAVTEHLGLPLGELTPDPGWEELSDHLSQARRAQQFSNELHDAVQLAIRTELSPRTWSKQDSIAVTELMKILSEVDLVDWYRHQKETAKQDADSRRTIWTWRDLPIEVVERDENDKIG